MNTCWDVVFTYTSPPPSTSLDAGQKKECGAAVGGRQLWSARDYNCVAGGVWCC